MAMTNGKEFQEERPRRAQKLRVLVLISHRESNARSLWYYICLSGIKMTDAPTLTKEVKADPATGTSPQVSKLPER